MDGQTVNQLTEGVKKEKNEYIQAREAKKKAELVKKAALAN